MHHSREAQNIHLRYIPLLFQGLIRLSRMPPWYTTLLFQGSVYLWAETFCEITGIHPCYFRALYADSFLEPQVYTPVISGFYTPNTGIFSSLSAGDNSHLTNQLTEYSCFHDDHASPQALIPVIPSVLVFIFFGKVCNHFTLYGNSSGKAI